MRNHDVCGLTDISVKTLRAWARAVSFAADQASREELLHALAHFRTVREATYGHATAGNPIGIDARCAEELEDELAHRSGTSRPASRVPSSVDGAPVSPGRGSVNP